MRHNGVRGEQIMPYNSERSPSFIQNCHAVPVPHLPVLGFSDLREVGVTDIHEPTTVCLQLMHVHRDIMTHKLNTVV